MFTDAWPFGQIGGHQQGREFL
ncbi:MAG: hypothetical protein JWM13_3048, partial [Arthrobacter sp.]|nr:hypothetical protein [Arthrobacter sp.]MCU1555562.1 hypothetical protein [Arthrobacter sp.]